MRVPRNGSPRLRAAIAGIIAAVVTIAGAAAALAHTPPPPMAGEVFDVRLHAVGASPAVTWSEHADGPGDVRAATLGAGGWAWADPAAPQPSEPDIALPRFASSLTTAADAADNRVAAWRTEAEVKAASRAAGLPYGAAQVIGGPADAAALELTAGLGAGGHAVALWTIGLVEKDPVSQLPTFERRQTRAADRLPDGTWSAPNDLGPPDAGREILPCA